MAVTLASLIEGNPDLVTAREHDGVPEAMERMREHNFSQLPVVEGEGKQLRAAGLISTATIARASLYLDIAPSKLRVHHAVERHPVRRKLDAELWRVLDVVRMGEVVLVEDNEAYLRGILTGQDFTSFLRRQTDAVIAVQEIEVAIKQLIEDEYRGRQDELAKAVDRELGVQRRDTEKAVRAVLNRCLGALEIKPTALNPAVFDEAFKKAFPDRAKYEFDRLTFSQYQNILLNDCWAPYKDEFDLPVENLRALLDTAREIRNQVMHNRGLPSAAERAKLDFCRELLDRIIDQRQEPAPAVVEVVPQPPVHEPVVAASEPTTEGSASEVSFPPWQWLEKVDASEDRVTRTFAEIEALIGAKLPPTALEHRSWWTNAEDALQAAQWLEVSWRVVSVNLTAQTATFGRNTSREEVLISIFGQMFKRLTENPEWTYELPSPAGRSWQVLQRLGVRGSSVSVVPGFTDGERFRVSIYIDGEAEANKAIFDTLASHRDELERAMMSPLVWERNPHRRASRVSLMYADVSVRSSDEEIEKLAAWVGVNLPRLWMDVCRILGQDGA